MAGTTFQREFNQNVSPSSLATGVASGAPAAQLALQSGYRDVYSVADVVASNTIMAQVQAGTYASDMAVYINAAIAYAVAHGFQAVFIPPGKYVLNGTRLGYRNSLITTVPNIAIIGAGYDTWLYLISGYSDNGGGDYTFFAPLASGDTSNLRISSLRIDGNVTNNAVIDSAANLRRAYAVLAETGDNIEIDHLWVQNVPARNVFCLGHNAATPDLTRIRVHDNLLYNVGPVANATAAGKNGTEQNDHSSIYAQFLNGSIYGNVFVNPVAPTAAMTEACLEIHGQNTDVYGNLVVNFTHGINSVAQYHDSYGNYFHHNRLLGITKQGIVFNGYSANIKRNRYNDNYIQLATSTAVPSGGIYQGRGQTSSAAPEDLEFARNVVCGDTASGNTGSGAGVDVIFAKRLRITDNVFKDLQGDAIYLNGVSNLTELGFEGVDILRNTCENVGLFTSVTLLWGVHVKNAGTTVTITIAAPGVITWTSHPFVVGSEVQFATTGALPTGIVAGTTYYVQSVPDANSFTIATTSGGAAVTTSGTQSGTQTGIASGRVFRDIVNDYNRIGKDTGPGVGQMRGVRIEGHGPVINCVTGRHNRFRGIQRGNRYSTTNTSLFLGVVREPRPVFVDRTVNSGAPQTGLYEAAGEVIHCANPTAATFMTKRVSTDGGASSATWAATTAFVKGQWIKSLTGTTVHEAQNSGISGSSEPTWPGLGLTVVDGGITWQQQDTAVAIFTTANTSA